MLILSGQPASYVSMHLGLLSRPRPPRPHASPFPSPYLPSLLVLQVLGLLFDANDRAGSPVPLSEFYNAAVSKDADLQEASPAGAEPLCSVV